MKARVSTSRVPVGPKDTPPAEWALFTGNLPKRGTAPYHVETRWPRHRVLNKAHAQAVLAKFHREDCPGQLQRDYIQYYVRNFDSEGFIVDSRLTASIPRDALPLGHQYAQMSMEKLQKCGNKKVFGRQEQAKLLRLAFSSVATNVSKPPASSGNFHANNMNTSSATCTLLQTSTETAAENAGRDAAAAAATTVPAAGPGVMEGSGRQLGGQTLEKTSTKTKVGQSACFFFRNRTRTKQQEPLAVLKRLAEPQKLRAEVKRLKTENEESESKREEQNLIIAKLDQQLFHKERERDELNESVEDLKKTLEEKEEEILALEEQSRQQETDQEELERQLEESRTARMGMEVDLHRQMDKCDDAELQRAALEAEMSDRKKKYDGMKKILKQAVSDHQDFVLELKEKGKRLQNLEKDVKRAEEEKAAMYEDLKKEQEENAKLQQAKDRRDEFAESAKIAAARLLYIVNSIYDSMGDEGNEERDEILGEVRNDLGSYWYDSLLTWGKSLAQ